MADIIEVELNNLEYQVSVELYEDTDYDYNDFDDSGSDACVESPGNLEVIDIYLVRKKNIYKVTNDIIWDEIKDLDLMELYIDQIG